MLLVMCNMVPSKCMFFTLNDNSTSTSWSQKFLTHVPDICLTLSSAKKFTKPWALKPTFIQCKRHEKIGQTISHFNLSQVYLFSIWEKCHLGCSYQSKSRNDDSNSGQVLHALLKLRTKCMSSEEKPQLARWNTLKDLFALTVMKKISILFSISSFGCKQSSSFPFLLKSEKLNFLLAGRF